MRPDSGLIPSSSLSLTSETPGLNLTGDLIMGVVFVLLFLLSLEASCLSRFFLFPAAPSTGREAYPKLRLTQEEACPSLVWRILGICVLKA